MCMCVSELMFMVLVLVAGLFGWLAGVLAWNEMWSGFCIISAHFKKLKNCKFFFFLGSTQDVWSVKQTV